MTDAANENLAELKRVKIKVGPLVLELIETFANDHYTVGETMAVITSILTHLYDYNLQEETKEKALWMRSYIVNGINSAMDACERGHKTLQ